MRRQTVTPAAPPERRAVARAGGGATPFPPGTDR
jgi:hypothetical protein